MAIIASNLDKKRTGNSAATKTNTQTAKTNTSSGTNGQLQQALQRAGYNTGTSSKETADAIMKYQKDNGLPVTGIADKNTTTVLYGNEKANPNNAVSAMQTVARNSVNAGLSTITPQTTTTTPATTTKSNATQPATSAAATTTPAAIQATKPFSYDDFSYDKQFSYDDFNYDKQFAYDDFNYDKQFSYDDFNYGNFSYGDYVQSDAVKQANALLQQQNANKPGAYQSQWQSQIDDYLNQIQNREKFSYDPNSDAMYQMYKDNYIQQGQMAMMDTMGQAAAMTGGYGNSYAQSVGQQAYNQQLSQLNEILPELQQMAYSRYADEGQRLQDMYNMYLGREDQDYGRYMDSLNAWQSERDYLAGRYDTERNFDYSKYEQDRAMAYDQYSNDRNLAYDQWSSNRDLAYNEFTADRNLAYDQWSSGRDLAYNEFTADRDLAYDQYKSNKDLAYNEFNTDRSMSYDKWSADRELAYNDYWNTINMDYQKQRDAVSDAQWQAQFNKSSSGGGGSSSASYRQPSREDDAYFAKLFGQQTKPEDLDALAQRMEASGYDPNYIASFYNQYATGLMGGSTPTSTTVTPTTVTPTGTNALQEEKKKKQEQAGGGGGLKSVVERYTY